MTPSIRHEFYNSVFALVEAVAHTRLPNTSKTLLMAYIAESDEESLAARARSAIVRYVQKELPTLEELRAKSRTKELSKLDHLVLRMEYAALRVR